MSGAEAGSPVSAPAGFLAPLRLKLRGPRVQGLLEMLHVGLRDEDVLASRFLIVSQYDGDRTRRQPLEMPGRYRFHSTRPAPCKRVSVAPSVDRQSKGGVNFRAHDATVLQCPAVEVGEGSACVMPRGSFRASVSQLSGDLLDHEPLSVERDRVTGPLALQLSIDGGLGGDAHDLIAVAHKLACRHGNNEIPSA